MTTTAAGPVNLATIWEAIAQRIPGEVALIHGSTAKTWGEFENRACRLASAFQAAGLGVGSKIAIDLYNCTEWLEAFYAAIKIRAVPANVNYRYLDDELRHLLTDSEAESLVFHASLADRIVGLRGKLPRVKLFVQVEEGASSKPVGSGVERFEDLIAKHAPASPIERSPEDQFLSYTGGTTGLPKGVMVTLGRSVSSVSFLGPMLGIDAQGSADPVGTAAAFAQQKRRIVALPASPLMHSTGFQMTALPALTFGGAVVTLTSKSLDADELIDAVAKNGVSLVAIVGDAIARPIMHALEARAAAGRPAKMDSLKLISSAGVAFSGEAKDAIFRHIPGVAILDACGASEGLTYGFRVYRKGDKTSGTNFMPAPGLQVIDEHGVARPAAPGLMGILANATGAAGYYNDPAKTAKTFRDINGVWCVVPGDYGRIEADGSLTLLGRGSTTINTGGEKVHPEEVENALRAYSGVDDCLVIGTPDERWGQRVTALVHVVGAKPLADALIAHVREKLAHYKAPKDVYFVSAIPRTPNGKADYPRAKELAAELGRTSSAAAK